MSTESKYFKGETRRFEIKIINCSIKELNNDEDVLILIQYLKDPNYFFDFNNKQKYLNQ